MSHSVHDLRYRLIEGPACTAPLRVITTRDMHWRGWQVTAMVLGSSHAVRLERDGHRVTELLTCAPPGGAGHAVLDARAEETASLHAAVHGLSCAVRLSLRSLDHGDALQGTYPADDVLEAAFPSAEGDGGAWTRIGWTAGDERLVVETVHSYPEESLVVHSESVFEEETA